MTEKTLPRRIGALDIAEEIAARIGSYVHMDFIQFLAVDQNRIHCWYMNSGDEGPSFEIVLLQTSDGWDMQLTEHPPGTEQNIEIP